MGKQYCPNMLLCCVRYWGNVIIMWHVNYNGSISKICKIETLLDKYKVNVGGQTVDCFKARQWTKKKLDMSEYVCLQSSRC
jgi:hypothetical protein